MATTQRAFVKPDPQYVRSHKGVFIGVGAVVLLALILTFSFLKFLLHPAMHILVVVLASIALAYLAYVLAKKDDTAAPTDAGPKWGILIAACFLYLIIAIAPLTSSRTDRVENCNPDHTLTVEDNAHAKEWVDYYRACPGGKYIVDNLTEKYILDNNKIPDWIMFKEGITSDPAGWWDYYSKTPGNPYKLDQVTAEEKRNFLTGNRRLPAHTLAGN